MRARCDDFRSFTVKELGRFMTAHPTEAVVRARFRCQGDDWSTRPRGHPEAPDSMTDWSQRGMPDPTAVRASASPTRSATVASARAGGMAWPLPPCPPGADKRQPQGAGACGRRPSPRPACGGQHGMPRLHISLKTLRDETVVRCP